ncbi:hypothetical protein ACTNDY_10830 [Tissierellaceae bacterium HCP3S3_D8]
MIRKKKIFIMLILIIAAIIIILFNIKVSKSEMTLFPRAELSHLYDMRDTYTKEKGYMKDIENYYKNSRYLSLKSNIDNEGEYTFCFSDVDLEEIKKYSDFEIVFDSGNVSFSQGDYLYLDDSYFNACLIRRGGIDISKKHFTVNISYVNDEYLFGYASALYIAPIGGGVRRIYYPLQNNSNNISVDIPQFNGIYILKEIGLFNVFKQLDGLDILEYKLNKSDTIKYRHMQ